MIKMITFSKFPIVFFYINFYSVHCHWSGKILYMYKCSTVFFVVNFWKYFEKNQLDPDTVKSKNLINIFFFILWFLSFDANFFLLLFSSLHPWQKQNNFRTPGGPRGATNLCMRSNELPWYLYEMVTQK